MTDRHNKCHLPMPKQNFLYLLAAPSRLHVSEAPSSLNQSFKPS